ncbi:F-box/WD repeat-containing protein 7 [Diplonema papillatum]|nr:F-box/WD repeat-containing protein 7 [Diplonema papillatum]
MSAQWSQEVDSEGSDTPRSKGSPNNGQNGVRAPSPTLLSPGGERRQFEELARGGAKAKREDVIVKRPPPYRAAEEINVTVTAVSLLECLLADMAKRKVNPVVHLAVAGADDYRISIPSVLRQLAAQCPPDMLLIPTNTLAKLPNELLLTVFSYLPPAETQQCEEVCTRWHRLASTAQAWRNLCVSSWPRFTEIRDHEITRQGTAATPLWWKRAYCAKMKAEKLWFRDQPASKPQVLLSQQNGIHSIQFDDNVLMTGSGNSHEICVWELKADACLEPVTSYRGHQGAVTTLQFDSERVVSGSLDSTIRIWNRRKNTERDSIELTGHRDKVWCLHYANNRLVSGSSDKTILVWDMDKGEYICALRDHRTSISCVRMDGTTVISGSAGNSLRVWDVGNGGVCTAKLRGHEKGVFSVQFDDAKIVSGSLDCTIRVWDRRLDYKSIKVLHAADDEGPDAKAGIICCSYDDTKIVSGGADHVVKVWDMRMWRRVHTWEGHTHWITSMQFDEGKLITGSRDKSVMLWKV